MAARRTDRHKARESNEAPAPVRPPRGDAAGGLGSRASARRAPTEGRNGEMLTRKEDPPGMAISKPAAALRGISCVQGEPELWPLNIEVCYYWPSERPYT